MRENIILECTECKNRNYATQKNKKNDPNRIEFKKYCKGIVLGDFLDCGNEKWLEEFFVELSGIHQIPIVGGFKITHNRKKITIPIGKNVILSGVNLKILK